VIRHIILTYTYGGINRFSGRLWLSVIFDYPANGNQSLARIIEVLLYNHMMWNWNFLRTNLPLQFIHRFQNGKESQDCLCLFADSFGQTDWLHWYCYPDWWFISSTKCLCFHRNIWLCYGALLSRPFIIHYFHTTYFSRLSFKYCVWVR
jgi:hypothetical protein